MNKIFLFSLLTLGLQQIQSQEIFTRKDSLHGGLRFERTCFDVQRYDLNIKINPVDKSIIGYNEISFKVVENTNKIQIDLFENMQVDSIILNNKKLQYKREFDAVFIDFGKQLLKNSNQKIKFYYSGKPLIAENAPWDGGFVWTKDNNEKDWIASAVQGTGASLWYPVKDSQSDEPDLGATIKVVVPNGLMNISNGKFIGKEDLNNGFTRWDWEVKYPINNYCISVNIGDYVHFGENYKGLDLDYYVLREDEQKARIQFEQVKPMMDCFQSKFGPYPFPEDGYKLVQTPYLGMEHQSAVAYGNKFGNGYLGRDLSKTGIGLTFDFIIIHESGHEWFGNSITSKDIADMWIHEAFTCYSESVFIECQLGAEKSQIYINGLANNIKNDKPIIGQYDVNAEGSGDMYYKGALMLNTIRSMINDDNKWWALILAYSNTYKHKIIDAQTVIDFFNQKSGLNLTPIFNQYLKYVNIPILELKLENKRLQFRWKTDVKNFEMPVDIEFQNKKMRLEVSNQWKSSKFTVNDIQDINVLRNSFYIDVKVSLQ